MYKVKSMEKEFIFNSARENNFCEYIVQFIAGIVYICITANTSFICFYVQNKSITQQDYFSVSSKEKVNPLIFKNQS